jgi:V/A-type H+/Na+-transporting ATPase subunit I
MFFPKAMTEVQLIVPSKDLLAVTEVLGSRAVFHQIDSTYLGVEALGQGVWQEKAASYATLERRIQVILQALNLEEQPYTGTFDYNSMAELGSLRSAVERMETDVKQASDQQTAEKKNLEQLESQLEQLEPIADLNVGAGALSKSRYVYSVLGIIPAANVSRLETSLSRIPHSFFTLREDPQKPVVWILGPRSNSDVIERAVKSAYLIPLILPEGIEGTPAQMTAAIRASIEASKRKIADLDAQLLKLMQTHQKELLAVSWDVHASRITAETIARFGQLRHTFVMVGWVPSAELPGLTQRVKQSSAEILIEATEIGRAGQHSNVPVALRNPGPFGPFELLVNTYARPRYEEIDPTVLIAVTFPLLFGAMFGDVGHGLVLALFGGLLVSKAVPALRGAARLGGVVLACGLVATLFGFLYGSFFGFEDILPNNPFFKQFFWMHPINNIITALGIAVGLGVVLLIFGFFLSLYNMFRARDWGRFFFDSNGLAGLILYGSFLGLLVAGAGSFIAHLQIPGGLFPLLGSLFVLAALVGVVFSEPLKRLVEGHRPLIEGGLALFSVQALAELFEKFLSMFSNTMSFVRVGAFAVAHAGLSLAIFVFAGLASGNTNTGIGYWVVIVLGNLFVTLFEGFIVGIQTMRLHYYEFFSKFFSGGGAAYEPLALPHAEKLNTSTQ